MRFSVIIPLYNKAPYIEKALRSVMSQTFMDYEIIVVDDGSIDDSATIAEKVLQEFSTPSKLIRQKNAGVSMARNNGVSFSQGDYLCFLDADDWWAPTFLEEMSHFIEEYPEAGIYGTNYTIVNETKHKTRVAPIGVEPGFEKGYINYCQVYAKTLAMPLWTGAVCIPRDVFDEMHGFPKGIKLGEDFLLWLNIALNHKVAYLNKSLAYYNQDVEMANRGVVNTGYKPDYFMTFHFNQFEVEETKDHDVKVLLDRLRVYSLLRFRLTNLCKEKVNHEIAKVDFANVDKKYWFYYKLPYPLVRTYYNLKVLVSNLKRIIR